MHIHVSSLAVVVIECRGYPHTLYIKAPHSILYTAAASYSKWNILSNHEYTTLVVSEIALTCQFAVSLCVYICCWSYITK